MNKIYDKTNGRALRPFARGKEYPARGPVGSEDHDILCPPLDGKTVTALRVLIRSPFLTLPATVTRDVFLSAGEHEAKKKCRSRDGRKKQDAQTVGATDTLKSKNGEGGFEKLGLEQPKGINAPNGKFTASRAFNVLLVCV